MEQRFEIFTRSIISIYRLIQKIKNTETCEYGLKGMHVMCLYFLGKHREGLTPVKLCKICAEDKAAISRTVVVLKEKGLIRELRETERKKYRNAVCLSEKGREIADGISEKVENALNAGGAGLSEEERVKFYDALLLVAKNLERYFSSITVTGKENVKENENNERI